MKIKIGLIILLITTTALAFKEVVSQDTSKKSDIKMNKKTDKIKQIITKTPEEWKKQLSPISFEVLRQQGTERPFTGKYNDHFETGNYYCAGCNSLLFESTSKFKSGCGWPSFDKPINSQNIKEIFDKSHGMVRTEIRCARCGGHLGHVFNDGPTSTGLRYCINSAALKFVPDSTK